MEMGEKMIIVKLASGLAGWGRGSFFLFISSFFFLFFKSVSKDLEEDKK